MINDDALAELGEGGTKWRAVTGLLLLLLLLRGERECVLPNDLWATGFNDYWSAPTLLPTKVRALIPSLLSEDLEYGTCY